MLLSHLDGVIVLSEQWRDETTSSRSREMQQIPPEDWAENQQCYGIQEEEYHPGSDDTHLDMLHNIAM